MYSSGLLRGSFIVFSGKKLGKRLGNCDPDFVIPHLSNSQLSWSA